jgi:hypothetical protein
LEVALNKQAVNLLTLGVKRFLNDSHIGKKKAENYYNALTDKENFNVCSSCPLNNKFGTELTGCNSFLDELSELGGGFVGFRGISCESEREYITEALRKILQKKRFAKI